MRKLLIPLMACLTLSACIQNDLPLPVIKGAVVSIDVEGATGITIDEAKRTVRVQLDEVIDPSAVNVRDASYSFKGTTSEPELIGIHDLSSPFEFNLHTYQDYSWTLSAFQKIDRSFSVKGQIGSSVIDEVNKRVVAFISPEEDLEDVTVTSLKLGPREITTYSPVMSEARDFTNGLEMTVSYGSVIEKWLLYVEVSDISVTLDSVDPWTRCAWLVASGTDGAENGFRYRPSGTQDWIECTEIISEAGTFRTCIRGLLPETEYECLAFSGTDETETASFVTEAEKQLPNNGFETFGHPESSVFCSWFDPQSPSPELTSKWWDSGNIGSSSIGSAYCICIPDTENKVEGDASAELISRNVIIKFAAGNIFSGEFANLVGTQGGIINFGRPWSLRPQALRIWLKYECGAIDVIDSYPEDNPVKMGDPDQCSIWIALGDWEYRKYGGTSQCPVQVNTTDKSTFFNKDSEAVIAYGSFVADTSSSLWEGKPQVIGKAEEGWVQVEIPFDYRVLNRKPTHIIVSIASSRFGDYFTGSSKSRLWVDDIELVY